MLLSQLKTEIGQHKQGYTTWRRSHTSRHDLHSFTSVTKYALSLHMAHACVHILDPLIRNCFSLLSTLHFTMHTLKLTHFLWEGFANLSKNMWLSLRSQHFVLRKHYLAVCADYCQTVLHDDTDSIFFILVGPQILAYSRDLINDGWIKEVVIGTDINTMKHSPLTPTQPQQFP